MKFKELKEKLEKTETQTEEKELFEEYWDSNAWIRFIFISLFIIIILIILWIGLWLFIRLVRFIAF